MTDHSVSPPSDARELAFLELGERLRQRGQLDAAAAVAQAGLAHYPALADAHDLLGRIAADQGDEAQARTAWQAALECDPTHAGAHKGLAFLSFRQRDFALAERHLEAALRMTPHDPAILAALDRVRMVRPSVYAEAPPRIDDPDNGFILFDPLGMRMAGGLGTGWPEAQADAAAAEGAGVVREAGRAAQFLGLGAWHRLVIESGNARMVLLPVTHDATLLAVRPGTTPVGRLLAVASRAVPVARDWLGRML